MNQCRPWLSLAALLALAGCCMSPPSPVDGVPYGAWGEEATSPDRGPPPEPVSVPVDAPSEPKECTPPPAEITKPSVSPSPAPVSPAKPAIAVDPLRQPLRLPLPAIDRSPGLALDKGAPLGVFDSGSQRIGQLPGPTLTNGTGLAPSLGDVAGQPSAFKPSSAGLNSTLGSPSPSEKNSPISLGQLDSLSSPRLNGTNAQLGAVSASGATTTRVEQAPSLSLGSAKSAAADNTQPLTVAIPADGSASASDTNSSLRLGVGPDSQVSDAAKGQIVAIQVAPGEVSKIGSTARSPSLSVSATSLPSGSAIPGTAGVSVGAAQAIAPESSKTSPSLVVSGVKALPVPAPGQVTSLSEPSAPQGRQSASSAKVDIHSPREPSAYLKETLNAPTAKGVTPPRVTEIKVADSLAVKTGTPVARSSQTVSTPVVVKEPVSQPLVKDRSATISSGNVLQATAPTAEEIAQREEEKRKREEEVRRSESSLRQWLHDHLPLFF